MKAARLGVDPSARTSKAGAEAPVPWHEISGQDACGRLGVSADTGLGREEAAQRLQRVGLNRVRAEKAESFWEMFLGELRDPMILLLLVTGALYAVWGQPADAVTIFIVIFAMVAVEVVNEHRAETAIAALSRLSEPTATLRRGGMWVDVPTEQVVPGDIIRLDAGRRVPADGRLLETYTLSADESSLTGESIPVDKDADIVPPKPTPLAERHNMVYAGTVITPDDWLGRRHGSVCDVQHADPGRPDALQDRAVKWAGLGPDCGTGGGRHVLDGSVEAAARNGLAHECARGPAP